MNDEHAELLLDEVRRIRRFVELLAEPAIAQRDAKLRDELQRIVGSSAKKQQSVLLMDGTRTQKEILEQTAGNQGNLSTMVGQMETAGLLVQGKKHPKLSISIPSNFFDTNATTE
jgi:hypothetical protein